MQDVIKTRRLILRPLRLSDAANLSKYGSDFEIAKMTGSYPHPFPLLAAEFKIMQSRAAWRRGAAYPFVITQDGSDFIGIVDIFKRLPDDDFELGYWIARPFWGQGFASEAARALMEAFAAHTNGRIIHAGVYEDNPASMRIIEKLGFKPTGETNLSFSMARLKKTPGHRYVYNARGEHDRGL